jgi:hypothetical protein
VEGGPYLGYFADELVLVFGVVDSNFSVDYSQSAGELYQILWAMFVRVISLLPVYPEYGL